VDWPCQLRAVDLFDSDKFYCPDADETDAGVSALLSQPIAISSS
jgi:hypothetical protein